MDRLFRLKSATAKEIQTEMEQPPSYSAVRATLRVMEDKGLVKHQADGARYVYAPALSLQKAKKNALRRVLDVFFDSSLEDAVATLLEVSDAKLDDNELQRIKRMIADAREREES